jgi:hypothetical protein
MLQRAGPYCNALPGYAQAKQHYFSSELLEQFAFFGDGESSERSLGRSDMSLDGADRSDRGGGLSVDSGSDQDDEDEDHAYDSRPNRMPFLYRLIATPRGHARANSASLGLPHCFVLHSCRSMARSYGYFHAACCVLHAYITRCSWSSAGEEDAEYQRRKRDGVVSPDPEHEVPRAFSQLGMHAMGWSARASGSERERWWLKAELESQNESLRRQLRDAGAEPVAAEEAGGEYSEEEPRSFWLVTGSVVPEEPNGLRRLDKAITQHIRQAKIVMNKLRAGVRPSAGDPAEPAPLRRFDGAEPQLGRLDSDKADPAASSHALANGAAVDSAMAWRDQPTAYMGTAAPGLSNGAIVALGDSDGGAPHADLPAEECADGRAWADADAHSGEVADERAWNPPALAPARGRQGSLAPKTWDVFLGGTVDAGQGRAQDGLDGGARSGSGARLSEGALSPSSSRGSARAFEIALDVADGTRSDRCALSTAIRSVASAPCFGCGSFRAILGHFGYIAFSSASVESPDLARHGSVGARGAADEASSAGAACASAAAPTHARAGNLKRTARHETRRVAARAACSTGWARRA